MTGTEPKMIPAVNHKSSSPNVHPRPGGGWRTRGAVALLDVAGKEVVEIDASPVAVVNSEATPPKLESTLF